MGVRQHRGGRLGASQVGALLSNRAVLGERWGNLNKQDRPQTCIQVAYPAVTNPELFQKV